MFLAYFESTWIGAKRTRGNRSNPRFSIDMWSIYSNITNDRRTTNNAVESYNARWNQSIGTNFNIWNVIKKFKAEDSLARTKLQELVTGVRRDSNPSQLDERKAKYRRLRDALQNFDESNISEFLYGLREL